MVKFIIMTLMFLRSESMAGKFISSTDIDQIPLQQYKNTVHLVSDVQEYFKASSVFLIYKGDESIQTTTLMLHLIRQFSTKLILSLTLNYTDVTHHYSHYRDHIIRPFFVVLLGSITDVQQFQRICHEFDMSHPRWLIIFTEYTELCNRSWKNYFNVAFDTEMLVKCLGDPIVREWYSLKEGSMVVNKLATWDPKKRFMLKTKKNFYERRHTLAGKVLHIATVKESPFIAAQGPLNGLFAQILYELSYTLNFTVIISYKEESYGTYNESTGRWSGVIGRLSKREVDLGVAEFTMTGQRLDTVDFTLPIMLSRNQLYMKQPDGSALQWSGYFKVYTSDVWISLEIMYVIISLIITFIRLIIKENPIPPNHISENYLCVFGVYCQQGLTDFPKASALRIAYFSILVTAVVFLAIYSACLISYLTVSTPGLPFVNLAEFVEDGSYGLIAFQGSADYALFATSEDRMLKKMMKLMIGRRSLPKTMMAGFKQACKNKVAFYATEAVKTQISARIPCNLVFLESGRIDSLGMTLTKKNQYTGVINYHLQKFKDVGIMNRLRSLVYKKVSSSDNRYKPMNIRGIVTILLILGVGAALSLIILLVEIMTYRIKATKQNKKIVTTYQNQIVITKNTLICENRLPI